ncbi:MAG: hypothetical protein AABX88_03095, partial [Nanoarchaeota archaeon]
MPCAFVRRFNKTPNHSELLALIVNNSRRAIARGVNLFKENFAKFKESQNYHTEHFENSFEKARNKNYSNFSIEKLA